MKYLLATLPALVALALFVVFANWVPQVGWQPMKVGGIAAETSPAELARLGEGIVRDRGCLICHALDPALGRTAPPRAPNLYGIGSWAEVDYIVQSLYEPAAEVVEGYPPIMPIVTAPPAKLNYEEVVAVIDYLLSLGGRPRVRVGDIPRPPQ